MLDSKTKFKKKIQLLNLRKKESFQFVPETANAGRQEASSKKQARHERSLWGQLSLFSFKGR